MIVREMTAADKADALGWMGRRYGEFPPEFFPETGVCAADGGVLRAVIPIYFEATSKTAVAGHCMANPKNTPRQSRAAVEAAMREAVRYVADRGRVWLITIYGKRSINRIAERIGFAAADRVEEKFMKVR